MGLINVVIIFFEAWKEKIASAKFYLFKGNKTICHYLGKYPCRSDFSFVFLRKFFGYKHHDTYFIDCL